MAEDFLSGSQSSLMDPGGGGLLGGGTGGGPSNYTGGDFFSQNAGLLGGLGAAGAAGYAAFGGNQQLPYAPQLQGTIQNLGGIAQTAGGGYEELMGRGRAFMDPIMSGKLPTGQEQVIQNMIKGQTTQTKGRYASLGLSGSTMEGDAITNVQNQAESQRIQLQKEMAQLGSQAVAQAIQELGLAERAFGDQGAIYTKMMDAQMKADANQANAIASFAKAIGSAIAFI